jgi:hypothetical protein
MTDAIKKGVIPTRVLDIIGKEYDNVFRINEYFDE